MKATKTAAATDAQEEHIEDAHHGPAKYALHGQIGATQFFIGEHLLDAVEVRERITNGLLEDINGNVIERVQIPRPTKDPRDPLVSSVVAEGIGRI